MSEMRFDTEKMVERLEDAGVPQAQARAHVSLLMNSINTTEESIIERCASKHQIADHVAVIKAEFEKQRLHFDDQFENLRLYLDAELEKQRLHFEARLSETRGELIKWVVSAGILQMALITGLVLKLIP